MKILHINASYKPAYIYGGPTMSVAKLCEELIMAGQDVNVYATTANGGGELDVPINAITITSGVPVHFFKRITKDHSHLSPTLLNHFNKIVKEQDIIHIHAWWNLVSIGTAFICWLKGKQYVLSPRGTLGAYSFHNRTSLPKRLFHQLLGKRLLKKAIFQVSSSKEANDIEKLINGARIAIIPNFVELGGTFNTQEVNHNCDKLQLLFFSRIEEKKGLNFLLKALELIDIPFQLNIYGQGDTNYIDSLQQNIPDQLKSSIAWKGSVYGSDKFKVLAAHHLLILPSYDENFANVVIESLAVGTAVCLSPNVGLADYVVEKSLGWICDREPQHIANTLHLIAGRKSDLQHIREKAPATIKRDFSTETLLQQYLSFYHSIIQ